MVRNLRKRRLDVWVHCCCRGLPGDDGPPAVVRRLYIDHEAPRCCDRATLQYKSVPDCGAIQINTKRCKNRSEFRSRVRLLALSNKVKRGQQGGHLRRRRRMMSPERDHSTGGDAGKCLCPCI